MISKNIFIRISILLFLWSSLSYAVPNSQFSVAISAESVAKVSVYYQGKSVSEESVDFPLPVHGLSQKLERTSSTFHFIGNVDEAEIIFAESEFILPQIYGGNTSMLLTGNFIYGGAVTSAQQRLQVPVLKNLSQGTTANGVKIKFASQFTAGNYTKGDYASVFTLIVTPVI